MMQKIIERVNRDIVVNFFESIPLLNPSLFEPLIFLNTSSFLVLSPLLGLVLQQHKPIFHLTQCSRGYLNVREK